MGVLFVSFVKSPLLILGSPKQMYFKNKTNKDHPEERQCAVSETTSVLASLFSLFLVFDFGAESAFMKYSILHPTAVSEYLSVSWLAV